MFKFKFCALHSVLRTIIYEKCPNVEFCWSLIFCFWIKHKTLRIVYRQYISDGFSTRKLSVFGAFCSYFLAFGLNTDIFSKSSYSVQIRENTDQKNSEYGHCLRSIFHMVRRNRVEKVVFFDYAVFDKNNQGVNNDNKRKRIKNGFFKNHYKDKK